jgi:hypothetical protein
MLFRETVAVYCENHTEHRDTLCGQNAEFWYRKAGGTLSNYLALKLNKLQIKQQTASDIINIQLSVTTEV